MQIGERIRAERLRIGLTQRALARAVGVGSDVVSRWERGEMGVSVDKLRALADTFGVTMDVLAGRAA